MSAEPAVGRASFSIDDLAPGWRVDRDIYANHTLLVAAGVTLTKGLIEGFRSHGVSTIEIARDSELVTLARRSTEDRLVELLATAESIYGQHGVESAIPPEVLDEATGQLEEFFGEIEKGQPVDYDKIRKLSRLLVEKLSTRSHLAAKLLDLDEADRYTYRHSIDVGLLFALIASDWVESEQELEDLIFGALLHDLGKAKIDAKILNKPDKLDDNEWTIIKRHPSWGAEMMTEAGASDTAVAIGRWHHERIDGSGYPDGLRGDQVDRFVKLAAVCDVYDALTTTRSYKKKMDFAKAIDVVLQSCGTHFDPAVAHEFICRVGRYPVGSFVQLSTGEVAVVLRVNEDAISRPVVSRVVDPDGSMRPHGEEFDLSQQGEVYIAGLVTG